MDSLADPNGSKDAKTNGSGPSGNGRVTLEDSSPGDLMEVEIIRVEWASPRCGWTDRYVRRGETLQCLDAGEEGVTLARGDGSRMVIPHECASSICVRFLHDHLAVSADGSGGAPTA